MWERKEQQWQHLCSILLEQISIFISHASHIPTLSIHCALRLLPCLFFSSIFYNLGNVGGRKSVIFKKVLFLKYIPSFTSHIPTLSSSYPPLLADKPAKHNPS